MMQETKPTKMLKQTPQLTHTVSHDRALQEDELNVVTGGALLQNGVSNVIKSIGKALNTAARPL
jgi:hypothetical protein